MIKKLILRSSLFRLWLSFKRSLSYQNRVLRELYWMAHLDWRFKSRNELEGLDLRMGNWALGPAGMSILLDALNQVKHPKVLELGLGESTKILLEIRKLEKHVVIDHDKSWVEYWTSQQEQRGKSIPIVEVYPMLLSKNHSQYDFGATSIGNEFNIFLVDGPFGAPNESRRNILDIANDWKVDQEFVVIIDDVHRVGELQTYAALKAKLDTKGISYKSRKISDLKEVGVVCSMHHWQLLSI